MTSSHYHVAVSARGVTGVTGAGFAPCGLAIVPVVRSTPITGGTFHVLPARTGSCLPVALAQPVRALGRVRPR